MYYGNKEHRIAYEVLKFGIKNALCMRVDYETHERISDRPYILKKSGINCISNNFMKFYKIKPHENI